MSTRQQVYLCPNCGDTKTIKAHPTQSEWSFAEELPETLPCTARRCEETMVKVGRSLLEANILKKRLAEQMSDYVATNPRYDTFDKRDAIIEAIWVLTNDIGAANSFLKAIGVDIDLNKYDFARNRKRVKITNSTESLAEFTKGSQ